MARWKKPKKQRPHVDEDGAVWVPLDKVMQNAIEQQLDAFREKFGREPLPEDPLFFDPDASGDIPQRLSEKRVWALSIVADYMLFQGAPRRSRSGIRTAPRTGCHPTN